MKDTEELAKKIKNAHDWQECSDELAQLCELAGLEEEWKAADGESFEAVVFKAADILGVEIL